MHNAENPTLPVSSSPREDHTLRTQRGTDGSRSEEGTPAGAPFPLIAGYDLEKELGRGGMGVVYQARQTALGRPVALKMILHAEYASADERQRFSREAEALARLRHENIVQVYELGEHEGRAFISLEFVEGGSLAQRLRDGPLPAQEAARLVEQLARAMEIAHAAGILHRDLKPANILLAACGLAPLHPKITDFGLARRLDEAGQTHSGAVLGTPSYMAPEQAAGNVRALDARTDIYALGAILYECLTGRPPFRAATVMETLQQVLHAEPVSVRYLQPATPVDLETICLKCLRKPPEQRYQGAEALADDLHRYCDGEPIQARPVSRIERIIKWARRRPAVAGLMAALLLLAVLVGVLFVVEYGRRASEEQRTLADLKSAEAQQERDRAEGLKAEAEIERDRAEILKAEAETERDRANALKKEEEKQRKIAEDAQKEARKQWERAEGLVYAGQLAQAQAAWKEGNVAAARGFLDDCRREMRGWEHALLRQRFDETQVTLRGHTNIVTSACFSPDGKYLASAASDASVRLWDAATGRLLRTLRGHTSLGVECVCFSPDGKYVASSGEDKTVRLWDAVTGQDLRTFKGHASIVHGVCFSPDGRRLASASRDRMVKLWDAATGQELRTLKGHAGDVHSVCFSPDGKRLASASHDRTVKLWDAAMGQELRTLKGHTGDVRSVCFCPDGKRLASEGGMVKVWDAATGEDLLTFEGGIGVCFSPDGRRLASAGKIVSLWDAATGQKLRTLQGHTGALHLGIPGLVFAASVCFSPDGKRLASSGGDDTIRLWDVAQGQDLPTLKGHSGDIHSVCFSPDGKRLASADDKTVKVWDVVTRQILRTIACRSGSVCFSPDGNLLAAASSIGDGTDGRVKVFDARTGQLRITTHKGHSGAVSRVCYSPDGKRLASAGTDKTVKLWDAATGQELLTLKEEFDNTESLCFSPDGLRLASAAGEKVKLRDATTGQELRILKGNFQSICFSPDGQRLAGANGPETVQLWDAATGKQLLTLKGHLESVQSVCFSPDGKRLASAGGDLTVRLWDAATGLELLTLKGHTDVLPSWQSICFSPDGKRLALGTSDKTIKLWEIATGQDLLAIKGDNEKPVSLSFSTDGKRIVSRYQDAGVRSWDAVSGEPIVPCTDRAPPKRQINPLSPDGSRRVHIDGTVFRIVDLKDPRPLSDLVFLRQLNDAPARLRWHRAEAAESETKQQWFAAAFHLRQLIAAKEADAIQLQERLKRCEDKLRQP